MRDIFFVHFGTLSTNSALQLPEQCTRLRSSKLRSFHPVYWTWQWVECTQMISAVTRSQPKRDPLGCAGNGDPHHGCAVKKSAATVWCCGLLLSSEFLVVNFAQMGGQAGSIDMISQLTTLLFINWLNQAVSVMLALWCPLWTTVLCP